MIRIGDFARIAGVSIATLRHYDEEGLLAPSFISPESGYRFYEASQLGELNRILVLKDLGFSLPEVRNLMQEPPDVVDMRRLLAIKRAEAESRLETELAQIKRIEHRIVIIEKEPQMPHLEVVKKTVPAMTVAAIHLEIPTNDQVPQILSDAYCCLESSLAAGKVQRRGPSMAIWSSSPADMTDETVDAAIPIEGTPIGEGVEVRTLPETLVAAVVHTGPFEEFHQCHVVLSDWLGSNGYRLEGAYREIYHVCSEENATTEVQYPIVRA